MTGSIFARRKQPLRRPSKGVITDPRDLSAEMDYPRIKDRKEYLVDGRESIIAPSEELRTQKSCGGPISKPLPKMSPLPDTLEARVSP